jgi:hypothetical protein
MTLYLLNDGVSMEVVLQEVLSAIKNSMEAGGGIKAPGVIRAKYVSPELKTPGSLQSTGGANLQTKSKDSSLSSGMAVLLSLGAFSALVAALIFRYRYNAGTGKGSNESTVATGSQITGAGSNLSSAAGSVSTSSSPFSGMLPSAYRLGGNNTTMFAILEGDSDSSQAQHSDIIVSDSGYTTEDSETREPSQPYLQTVFDASVLGGHNMFDDDDEEELIFDTMMDAEEQDSNSV